MVVASQLAANISIQGATQAQATFSSMSSGSKKAQADLNQLQSVAQDVANVVQNKFAAALRSSQGPLQTLAQQAADAGIDTTKLSDLQAKAAVAADNLAIAQDRAAAALQKAANITIDAASSEAQITAAQNQASLAADKVAVAQNSAAAAMSKLQVEADSVSTAVAESGVKTTAFSAATTEAETSTGGFLSGIKGAAGGLLDFGMKASMTLMGVEMLGGMFMKVATAAGDMIGGFQQQLTKLTTTAGESQSNIKSVGQGILAMAGPTATSVKSLGDAMYWVESGGAHGKKALDDLKIAAMGAKTENADLTDVTKALMFTLSNYGDTGLTAAGAMNTLITATGEGTLTLQGLSGAVSNVMPTAHAFGISLADVTGGLATMSSQGDDASAAATHLAMMIKTLEAPASAGSKAIASIGLTTQQVSDEMRVSMPGALALIVDHLKNKFPEGSAAYNEALKNISGGSRSMQAILETTGSHLDTFKQNVDKITGAVKAGGDSIYGWNEVTQNFNFMVQQATAGAGAFAVAIGTALAPMIGGMIGSITGGVMPALNNFGQWIISVGIPKIQQFGATIAPLGSTIQDLGKWFVLALKDIGPTLEQIGKEAGVIFSNIMKYIGSVQFQNLIADFETLGNQIIRLDLSNLRALGPLAQGALGLLGSILTGIVIPAIDTFVFYLGQMGLFLNSGSVAADLVRGALIGIGSAFALMKISDFIEALPFMQAGFLEWAGAAWTAAAGTIAATWPILAIGAAIGLVVAGIVLAVQHWGDIMDWISGKAEQTRISVEQSHVKMAIAMDTNTANGAQKAINNIEIEKQGILQKLKETNDGAQKLQLEHDYNSLNAEETAQIAKLKQADDNKKKQLDKQKELQSAMEEAQKPWIQRMGDGIQYGFEAAAHWIGQAFTDAFNWVKGIFGDIGKWFTDRWHDIQGAFGNVGGWFHDRFTDAKNGITGAIGNIGQWFQDRWTDVKNIWGGIGQWFHDRWNELPAPLKATLAYIGDVFQTIWNILVAIWGKLGAKFQEWWGDAERPLAAFAIFIGTKILEAWNAVVGAFQWLGKWFGDRWTDTKNILSGVGGFFHDLFQGAWDRVVGVWNFLGKWFGDRWQDTKNILAPVGQVFHDIFQGAWNKVTAVWAPIGKWFGDRWNDIMGGVNTLKVNISNKWNEIKTDTSNIFKGMINGIIDQLNNGIGAVEGFINFFGQGLDDIAKSLGTKGTIPVAHLGRIPHYAAGTDSHPGGPAIVGERGREMVFMPPGAAVVPNDMTEMLLSMFDGKIPGYAGGVGDIASSIIGWVSGGAKSLLDNVVSALNIKAPNLGPMSNISSGIFNSLENWALSWVQSILPKFNFGAQAVNVPGTVQSWIASAMGLTNAPASWASDLAIIAMHESGGNPAAINLTDINAIEGHPSQGLFQTIPSTFAAYAIPGHKNILNPIDNAAAAIEYIIARYGSVFNVPGIVSLSKGGGYVGYANGGIINEPIVGKGLNTGTNYAFGENGKELVTPYVPSGVNLAQMAPTINVHNTIVVQPNDFNIDGRRMNRALQPYHIEDVRRISGANI